MQGIIPKEGLGDLDMSIITMTGSSSALRNSSGARLKITASARAAMSQRTCPMEV